jgi:di/tricarboxylate transporter
MELHRDMFMINKVRQIAEPGRKKYYALALIFICAAILFITKGLALFPSLLIIFTIMVVFGLITIQDIRREIDFNLIGILVLSLAIGQAMILSGAGQLMAGWIINLLAPYGTISILIGIVLITSFLTSFIVNVGAVSITFPIALSLSQTLGMDAMPFYLGIAYAASGAFITPIGYQTNMIVYGPGGYRFVDFIKIGFPVTLLYLAVTICGILLIYHKALI